MISKDEVFIKKKVCNVRSIISKKKIKKSTEKKVFFQFFISIFVML
jgi:hypothetical protein